MRDERDAAPRVAVFKTGRKLYPALERAIASAREEVLINFYAFHNDSIGRRFVECLAERVRAGVRVRVIFDSMGSWGNQDELLSILRGIGVEARIFRKRYEYLWRHPVSFLYRNHARIVSVDRRVLGLGGMGIGEIYHDRNDLFALIHAPVPRRVIALFDLLWMLSQEREAENDSISFGRASEVEPFPMLFSGPLPSEQTLYSWLYEKIRGAKKRVVIVTTWFFPPRDLLDELLGAIRRGVQVIVVTPYQTDRTRYDAFRGLPIPFILREGGAWYGLSNYAHQKFFLIDEYWTFGSANCDIISLRRNYEFNICGTGGTMLRLLQEDFAQLIEREKSGQSYPISFVLRLVGGFVWKFLEFWLTSSRKN